MKQYEKYLLLGILFGIWAGVYKDYRVIFYMDSIVAMFYIVMALVCIGSDE